MSCAELGIIEGMAASLDVRYAFTSASKCDFRLWPRAKVRPIRFHDLRHTTASLLMMAGANPAAVQKILRHSDPRITTEIYGHLSPEYLRGEVDRLSFGQKLTTRSLPEPVSTETNTTTPLKTINEISKINGGRRGFRTPDPLRVKQLLYH